MKVYSYEMNSLLSCTLPAINRAVFAFNACPLKTLNGWDLINEKSKFLCSALFGF